MSRKIDVNVPFVFCHQCSKLRINETEMYASSVEDSEKICEYSCKHLSVCKNAINLYARHLKKIEEAFGGEE